MVVSKRRGSDAGSRKKVVSHFRPRKVVAGIWRDDQSGLLT
jgi:hypothetical protein